MKIVHIIFTAAFLAPGISHAESVIKLDTESWCDDSGTLCWSRERASFSGVRFLAEPRMGELFQFGDNKIENDNFVDGVECGVEVNLFRGWAAIQALWIPSFEAQYDAQSPARTNLHDEDGLVTVEVGFAVGVSILDGLGAVGYTNLHLDRRDFIDPDANNMSEAAIYVNFQAASTVRAVFKRIQDD